MEKSCRGQDEGQRVKGGVKWGKENHECEDPEKTAGEIGESRGKMKSPYERNEGYFPKTSAKMKGGKKWLERNRVLKGC